MGLFTACAIAGIAAAGFLIEIVENTGVGIVVVSLFGVLAYISWVVWKNAAKKSFPLLSEEAAKKQLKKQGIDEQHEGVAKEVAKESVGDVAQDVAIEALKNLLP